MVEVTESQKRAVVERLESIQKVWPKVIKVAEEGKITSLPHEKMFIVEPAVKGLTSVNVKQYVVIVVCCPGEEIVG